MGPSPWKLRACTLAAAVALTSCAVDAASPDGGADAASRRDLQLVFEPEPDLVVDDGGGLTCPGNDPDCHRMEWGPPDHPFPLATDDPRDPLVRGNGVARDANGFLVIDTSHTVFNYLWIPNTHDLNDAGTVSKLDSKTVREVARYLSVTCSSLKTGGPQACDGTNGCCARDDEDRYQARLVRMPEPGHQSVQPGGNLPSRTAIDFNGDLFVANEAPGGQASVTKVSNDVAACIDRNKNGRIDTSADTNGNGWIEIDCNGDGAPDDLASVKARPCGNGLKQEFYGLDDECVLWTSNAFAPQAGGRALGIAASDTNVSDLWIGSHRLGTFRRVDGTTGLLEAEANLPNDCFDMSTGPNGVAVDASGIAWVPEKGQGKLCFFDTRKPVNVGVVRDPGWGPMQADGVTLDRDQNVWVGQDVARYTPDRSNGFANLGKGWWTRAGGVTGTRIVADSRNAKDYFAYSCTHNGVVQIPASTIKVMKADQQVMNAGWPVIAMPCLGVSVDSDQNIWGLDANVSTRALVDRVGAITQPKVNGQPMGNNTCPAGDSCPSRGAEPYSDLAGFGLRNISRPAASYNVVVPGCVDGNKAPADTGWIQVEWDAEVPPNTLLVVHARSANVAALDDPHWLNVPWTLDAVTSPMMLGAVLQPNWVPGGPRNLADGALWVELILKTQAQNATPRLKSLAVTWYCPK